MVTVVLARMYAALSIENQFTRTQIDGRTGCSVASKVAATFGPRFCSCIVLRLSSAVIHRVVSRKSQCGRRHNRTISRCSLMDNMIAIRRILPSRLVMMERRQTGDQRGHRNYDCNITMTSSLTFYTEKKIRIAVLSELLLAVSVGTLTRFSFTYSKF